MENKIWMISFENKEPFALCEQVNKFAKDNIVIATQTLYAEGKFVAFVYHK